MLAGLPLATIAPLQRMQNTAARLIFKLGTRESRACHCEPPSVALAASLLVGPVQAVLSHALSLLLLREVPGLSRQRCESH